MDETAINIVRGDTKFCEITVTNDGVAEDLSSWIVNYKIESMLGESLSSGVVPDVDPSRRDVGIIDWILSPIITDDLPEVCQYQLWISNTGVVRTIAMGPMVIDAV